MEKLTTDDIQNIIAFGNRATMNGAEADTWVRLKMKLSEETQRRQLAEAEPHGEG